MIEAKYRVYYEWNGPDKSDPCAREITDPETIREHLRNFPVEFETHLRFADDEDRSVQILEEIFDQRPPAVMVYVRSSLARKDYDPLLTKALNGLGLYAEKKEFEERD